MPLEFVSECSFEKWGWEWLSGLPGNGERAGGRAAYNSAMGAEAERANAIVVLIIVNSQWSARSAGGGHWSQRDRSGMSAVKKSPAKCERHRKFLMEMHAELPNTNQLLREQTTLSVEYQVDSGYCSPPAADSESAGTRVFVSVCAMKDHKMRRRTWI